MTCAAAGAAVSLAVPRGVLAVVPQGKLHQRRDPQHHRVVATRMGGTHRLLVRLQGAARAAVRGERRSPTMPALLSIALWRWLLNR